jgi:hypothetical protein
MQIKAIYLPDLAFDSSEGNFNFVYKSDTKTFDMEIDKEISYSEDSVLQDIESWLLFETKLITDDDGAEYGECKQISIEEFRKLKEV